MQRIVRQRIKSLSFIFILLVTILTGRLMQIQLISTESFSGHRINLIEKSVEQRTQSLIVDNGRGNFVDRNGKPLTHDYYPTLILFPFLKKLDWPKEELASILNVSSYILEREVQSITTPVIFKNGDRPIKLTHEQMEKIMDLQFPGIIAMDRTFPLEDKVADHLIGVTSENKPEFIKRYEEKVKNEFFSPNTPIGVTGLQLAFDPFLLPEGTTKLLYHVDRYGGPLFDMNVKYSAPANPYYPLTIKTTIDKEIQAKAERFIDQSEIRKGGIVLIDINKNEILSVVSRPSMNWRDPFSDSGTKNVMFERHFPGSVFKTVIAAAAIEMNIAKSNSKFDCNLDLYGEKNEYKGILTLDESFAKSCNYTFSYLGQQAEQIFPGAIETYAKRLGLMETVGWQGDVFHIKNFRQIPNEEQGIVWNDRSTNKGKKEIAQTSIGQKEVRVTPLAIANMMATIARGGKAMEVKVVDSIQYRTGAKLYQFPNNTLQAEGVSKYTTIKLQHLLRDVVTNDKGTGHLFSSLPYAVAGKSGTAETGLTDRNGNPLVNRWFAGYFPFEKPKYALVVVDLETANGSSKMTNVYRQMVQYLYDFDSLKED